MNYDEAPMELASLPGNSFIHSVLQSYPRKVHLPFFLSSITYFKDQTNFTRVCALYRFLKCSLTLSSLSKVFYSKIRRNFQEVVFQNRAYVFLGFTQFGLYAEYMNFQTPDRLLGVPLLKFFKNKRQFCILFLVKKRGKFSSGSKIFVIIFLPGIFGIFVFFVTKMHSGTYALSHAFLPKKTKRSSGLRIFYLGDSSVIGR